MSNDSSAAAMSETKELDEHLWLNLWAFLSSNDTEHGPVVATFTDWYSSSFLDINVSKTKEITIDFRTNPIVISPVVIDD